MSEIEIELPKLAPYQREYIESPKRFVAVEGSTGSGKTFVFTPWYVGHAHQPVNDGDEYWWVAPSINKAREVFDDVVRTIEAAGATPLYDITRSPAMKIKTPQGGIMVFKTGENPNNLFGTRNVRLIIVDEFTRCRISIWPALLSVANKTGCKIRFIGNYTGDTSAWHRWIIDMTGAEPDFQYFKTTAPQAVDAGIMPAAMMETARRTMQPVAFMALYMCEGTVDSSLLVDYGALSDMWTNDFVPEGDACLTCDIALHGSDKFVMGRWSGFRLKEIEVHEKRDAKEVENIIRGKATSYSIPMSRIAYDADGLGAYLMGYLNGALAYQGGRVAEPMQGHKMNYQNLRSQCHFLTAQGINDRAYMIDTPHYREELTQDLLAMLRTSGQNHSGAWGIIPKSGNGLNDPDSDTKKKTVMSLLGRSPDIGDMFVMRQYIDLKPKGHFIETLGEIAVKRRLDFRSKPNTNYPGGNTKFEGR